MTNHRADTTARASDNPLVADDPAATLGAESPTEPATESPTEPATESVAEEGLAAELAAAAPRRWWNRGTVALAALLLAGGAFVGGAYVQQQYGQPAAGSTRANPLRADGATGANGTRSGQFPGGLRQGTDAGVATPAPAGSAAPATTTGTVKLIDGKTVYVETGDGRVLTVRTTGSTAVRTTEKATLDDLKPGDPVTIQGSTTGTDTLTATSVTETAN